MIPKNTLAASFIWFVVVILFSISAETDGIVGFLSGGVAGFIVFILAYEFVENYL